MDSTWPFNFDCNQPSVKTSQYIDTVIIPELFYDSVMARNEKEVFEVIKYHPYLSVLILSFYDIQLKNSFYYKKGGKYGAYTKIQWKTHFGNKLVLNFNEQSQFYKYVTEARPYRTNFGFLINALNNYMTQLNTSLKIIHSGGIQYKYYQLVVNVHDNIEMERFIQKFLFKNQ